jgi:signal transduction histidine kinase
MSLRIRLSIIFSAMMAAAMLIVGVFAHVLVERNTRLAMERELAQEAQLLASNSLNQHTDVAPVPSAPSTVVEDPEDDPTLLTRIQAFSEACSLNGILNRLRGSISSGRVLPLSEDGLSALKQGQPWSEVSLVADSTHLVYSQPIVRNDHLVGVAQAARPYGAHQQTLAMLRDIMLIGGGLGTVLVFGLTWGLSGMALRPLSQLAFTAREIARRQDFKARLDAPAHDADVSKLAASLNSVLDQLHSAYQVAESQLAAQRDFVADLSHELRAPLTTVRGNLGLLQRAPMDEDERNAVLRDAVDEIERMSRLVNELLLLVRAQSPSQATQALRMQPVVLSTLAEGVCRKANAMAHGRTIVCDFQPNIIVNGNADALNQVLLILLDNAVKFTSPLGRIMLHVRADATHAHLTIQDNGVGISADVLPHIFDRYYRGGGDGQSRQGHGLGLAIAKSLIEAQGGTIRVESAPGRGSAFTVALPLS